MSQTPTMTLEEALAFLTQNIERTQPKQQFGTRVVIGTAANYAQIHLSIDGLDGKIPTHEYFKYLKITYFVNGQESNVFAINLTAPKYRPKGCPSGEGGHWWGHDNRFYRYQPDVKLITTEINRILDFLEIG